MTTTGFAAHRSERAIVETAAVAEPVSVQVEGEQRGQHHVGDELGRLGQWFADAPGRSASSSPGCQRRKTSGLPLPCITGRHRGSLADQPQHERHRVELLADGGEARDDGSGGGVCEADAMAIAAAAATPWVRNAAVRTAFARARRAFLWARTSAGSDSGGSFGQRRSARRAGGEATRSAAVQK